MSHKQPYIESPHQETDALPLLSRTPQAWGELAARNLSTFLADHAVCEQQAAMSALSMIGKYPEDAELVDRLAALAAEELVHMRRVLALMRRRGDPPPRRRTNPWVSALKKRIEARAEPELKADRLLVSALIEARSCERFTRLGEVIRDEAVAELLGDLGPAEKRHWRLFYDLAARLLPPAALAHRWRRWLEVECELSAGGGILPTVHG